MYFAVDAGGIDIGIDRSNPSRVYAAIWQRQSLGSTWYIGGVNSGIYRSTDGGDTWSRLTNGLPVGPDVGRIGLAIAPSSTNTVYALVINSGGNLLGVYKTTDAGDSWTTVNTTLTLSGFSYYFGNIRVDPS